jgi:Protein of unknown function (DUF2934)
MLVDDAAFRFSCLPMLVRFAGILAVEATIAQPHTFSRRDLMSRQTSSQPQTPHAATPMVSISHEKIAQRAYEKWVKRGRPAGTDVQDWVEAESELRAEMGRSTTTNAGTSGWQPTTGQRY